MLALPYVMTSVCLCLDVSLFLPEIFQQILIIFSQIEGLVLKAAECPQFQKFSFSQVPKLLNFSRIPGFS